RVRMPQTVEGSRRGDLPTLAGVVHGAHQRHSIPGRAIGPREDRGVRFPTRSYLLKQGHAFRSQRNTTRLAALAVSNEHRLRPDIEVAGPEREQLTRTAPRQQRRPNEWQEVRFAGVLQAGRLILREPAKAR